MTKKASNTKLLRRLPWWANALLALAGLLIAYAFGTRAIDTGSLLQYGASILIFILSIRLFIQIFKRNK